MPESPYEFHGYSEQDAQLLSELADPKAKIEEGFVVDLYGIRTRVDDTLNFWPDASKMAATQVLGLPIPGNFHWGAIEWIGLMRAVLAAKDKFRVMELGAGWGPAVVSSSVMARLRGISDIRMTAVEGDPHHFRRLRQHLTDNSFDPAQHNLFHAAVAQADGVAHWPVTEPSSTEFGFRPMDASGDYMHRTFAATAEVKLMAMTRLVRLENRWDLIHVDIQGAEASICRVAMPDLIARAKRVIIGTHSRTIEGDLITLFARNEWVLENEKPCKFAPHPTWDTLESLTTVDGCQVWCNPRVA